MDKGESGTVGTAEFDQLHAEAMDELRKAKSFYLAADDGGASVQTLYAVNAGKGADQLLEFNELALRGLRESAQEALEAGFGDLGVEVERGVGDDDFEANRDEAVGDLGVAESYFLVAVSSDGRLRAHCGLSERFARPLLMAASDALGRIAADQSHGGEG